MSPLIQGAVETCLKALKVRVYGKSGDNLKIRCPNPMHEDSTPSCYIHSGTGLWFCHGCHSNNDSAGKGNLYHFLKLFGRDDLIALYCPGVNEEIDIKKVLRERINQLFKKHDKTHKSIKVSLPEGFNQNFTGVLGARYLKYLRLRGLRRDVIRSLKLGFVHKHEKLGDRIVIPIYEKNKLVGYQARSIHKKAKKKYLFATGADTKKLLYNLDNVVGKEVIIVEGAFDAIALHQQGYCAVGIFGLNLTPEKVHKLVNKGVERIVFCLDSDKPAIAALNTMYREVYPFFDEVYNMHLPVGKDVDELEPGELKQIYDRKMRVVAVNTFRKIAI